jgi:hypothetical protein
VDLRKNQPGWGRCGQSRRKFDFLMKINQKGGRFRKKFSMISKSYFRRVGFDAAFILIAP